MGSALTQETGNDLTSFLFPVVVNWTSCTSCHQLCSIVDTGQKYSCSQSSTAASGGGWRRREIKTMPLGDYLINYTDVILDCTIYQTSFLLMTLSGSDSGFHVR